MIQDIFPSKLNNQYDKTAVVSANDYVICIFNNQILVDCAALEKKELMFPTAADVKSDKNLKEDTAFTYLFSVDDERYFLVNNKSVSIDGFAYMDVKDVRHSQAAPKHRVFALLTAKHLSDWYRDTQFCGRCGKPMAHSEKERAMYCDACGYTAYPRIMPAVIVGVTNGDQLLLTRYRTGYQHNALVAGFTEIGETVEETVAREVMEEAGVKVKNIRYYKSQPWGVANDILMGFYCDVDGDATIHMDETELKFAEWTKREDIVLQPDDFSLTNEMMMMFKDNKI